VYDMYPDWDEPAEAATPAEPAEAATPAEPATSQATREAPQAQVPHIRAAARRRSRKPGATPALNAVQASLDRRDNGGATRSGATPNGATPSEQASPAPASATRQ